MLGDLVLGVARARNVDHRVRLVDGDDAYALGERVDALYREGGECGGSGEEDVRRVLEEIVSAILERRCAREIGLEEGGDGGGDGGFGRDEERRPGVDLVDEGGGREEEENGSLLAVGPLDREEGEEESERPGAKKGSEVVSAIVR